MESTKADKEKVGDKIIGHEIIGKRASFFIGEDKDQPIKLVGPEDETIKLDELLLPPDGGWGWVIVIASFMSNIVVDGIILSFGLIAGPMRDDFLKSGQEVTLSSIAWVSSLQNGFYLMGGPFVSFLANRFGFRVVAILGAGVGSCGFLLSWLFCMSTPNLYALFLCYGFLGGVGFNLLYVPSVIAVGFYFEKRRALATGIAICGSGVGTFIMAPLTYALINKIGWRLTLVVHAGLILSCSIWGAMYRPLKPTVKPNRKQDEKLGKKASLTPFPSPSGTPLLMRIKRAREMEKWDSINSVEADGELRTTNASSYTARKASTQSLNNPLPLHKQNKRMSVPSMAMPMSGDIQLTIPRINTASSVRKNVVSGCDLKEIEEQDEAEESNVDETQGSKSVVKDENRQEQKPFSSTSTLRIQKIGNSFLMIDEMTKSRMLRVNSRSVINKPMYRDDIFYSGSMRRIPEYETHVSRGGLTSYEWTAAVASKPPAVTRNKGKNFLSKLSVLRKMLDFSLILSPTFVLLAVSGFITMLGFFVPFIYLKGIAIQNGVEESNVPLLISVIGIANTCGRIICGWLADRPSVNAVVINNAALTFGGIATAVAPLLNTYWLFIMYSIVFGLSIACFASLRSILLVELLGLKKLTNAFGLLCLFQGIAAMVGSPLAGWLFDTTGDYNYTFYAAGSFLILSGILCYPIQCVNRWEKNKDRSKNKD